MPFASLFVQSLGVQEALQLRMSKNRALGPLDTFGGAWKTSWFEECKQMVVSETIRCEPKRYIMRNSYLVLRTEEESMRKTRLFLCVSFAASSENIRLPAMVSSS